MIHGQTDSNKQYSYAEVEKTIMNLPRFPGNLQNLKNYLHRLNHPERDLRVIHVAGTNGKGSVCAFMDSILREAGYRTAMFTSPHLVTLRERFAMGGKAVSEEKVMDAFLTIRRLCSASQEALPGNLAFFEYLFLMAILIFKDEKPDYVLMETGLGGRLDPTVLSYPVLCIITSIGLDHTKILGETIPEIAREKAGIIKEGIPIVTLDEDNGAFPVISEVAEEKKSPCYSFNSRDLLILKKCENYIDFSIDNSYYNFSALRVAGFAGYQVLNGGLAALASRILLPDLPEEMVARGLLNMRWSGRMQEILPGIYVDGAHNPPAADRVVCDLEEKGGRWRLLFSVYEDKDYGRMIRRLAAWPFIRVYIAGMDDRRTASGKDLTCSFEEGSDLPVSGWPDIKSAFTAARKDLRDNECLLCLGSLHLIGEIFALTGRQTYLIESEET